jgi:3-dehydroquinate synthase
MNDTPSLSTVRVDLSGAAYDIHIGSVILPRLGRWAQELELGRHALVVSDDNVGPLYLPHVVESLQIHGFKVSTVTVPAGESTKCVAQLDRIWQAAVEAGIDRRGFVIALGGGVVGDLSGFAAASLFRGVQLVQIPTSLLSMVDSSVGGKTGINLPQGKNLVGAFHQASLVLADLAVLPSLPPREFSAGMAEVIKYGAIQDAEFFRWLEQNVAPLRALDMDCLARIVRRSCEVKAHIVKIDEREHAERAFLNFGHTLGHAVEQVTGYTRYLHGEAIAIGMHYAARLSSRLSGLPAADAARIRDLFLAFDLPVMDAGLPWDAMVKAMRVDKKSRDGSVRFVLLPSLGACSLPVAVDEQVLREEWDAMLSAG